MTAQRGRGEMLVGRSYTRSRRFPRVFGRMPGRDGGYLPGGPYTLTQGAVFLALLVVVWKLPVMDWLGPARWGVPLGAVFVRRARIESRTPVGWLVGLANHLAAPAAGILGGRPYRPDRPLWIRSRLYLHPATDRPVPATAASQGTRDPQRPNAVHSDAAVVASPLQLLLAQMRHHDTDEGE